MRLAGSDMLEVVQLERWGSEGAMSNALELVKMKLKETLCFGRSMLMVSLGRQV
jgi:hypothetical protein